MPKRIETLARQHAARLTPQQRGELVARVRAHTARLRAVNERPTPADLAAHHEGDKIVRTEAFDLVSRRLTETVLARDGRLVVSVPPQEFKTTLLRWLCLWLLADDPERRLVYASYASKLAATSGRIVRSLVETYGGDLGLTLARDHFDASDWQLDGHQGGMFTTGVGGSLTGRPADVMIIDDPLKNPEAAHSDTIRGALHDWWQSVARTRLAPGAPVVICQTRWHEDDLAGRRIGEGWPVVNIPALADGQTPDALGRPAGIYLTSTRGRLKADWDSLRADVGERDWAALYQGRPAPLEGGIFKTGWFDTWRLHTIPEGTLPPVVFVDPADNDGDGDEAGIILAAWHPETRRALILDDLSAPMTIARWARLALLTCVRRDAPTLAYERSLSQLDYRIREAWRELHLHATALRAVDLALDRALDRVARPDDGPEAYERNLGLLAELTPEDVTKILTFGETGPRRSKITAKGSKDLRAQLAAPMFETGRAVMVGRHPALEHQMSIWQPGMDSPDRMDTGVHAALYLSDLSAQVRTSRPTRRVPTRTYRTSRR